MLQQPPTTAIAYHLFPIINYHNSRVCINVRLQSHVSLSLVLQSVMMMMAAVVVVFQRGRSQRPRDVVLMIRIERELRRKLRHVSRTGVSSSMKFKTSLEREAQTTPRNSCVPSPLKSLSSNCIKLFARSENLLCVCVCVCSRARNYREKRFRFTSQVSDKMRKERMVIDKILWIEEWNLLLDSKKCNFFCCTEFLSYAMSLDINN